MEAALENPKEVYVLRLNSKKLTQFPAEITQLSNLEELFLMNNAIQEIPHSILQLKKLRKLILENNQIEVIPD